MSKDTSVDVDLIGARSGRTKLGSRAVLVELALRETASATFTLSRRGKPLAGKAFASVSAADDRVLTFPVPAQVAGGSAVLTIALKDAAANVTTLTRTVAIGKAKR